ncbi:hypothetical protein [Myxococcus faecalis]|uniref:hypothetical protein n=1 Tax=Myxococcus faecalis TaxID=3115646 RepID=UPI003CF854B4
MRLKTSTPREVVDLLDSVEPELRMFFEDHTSELLEDVAPLLPEESREAVLDEVLSLMVLGYLVRANEEDAPPRPPSVLA